MLRGLAVAGLTLGAVQVSAQPANPAPDSRPQFEVASIKSDKSEDRRILVGAGQGGRFRATNIPLQILITQAYEIKPFQLSGTPGWLSERYDVEARAEGNPSSREMLPMAQRLLEDRLQLRHHRRLMGKSIPLDRLIDYLSLYTGRKVIDKTNLPGKFDIDLQWSMEQSELQALPDEPQADPLGPSLGTALQEQLGLKLESQKGPVEMFVIDHVERPSEN